MITADHINKTITSMPTPDASGVRQGYVRGIPDVRLVSRGLEKPEISDRDRHVREVRDILDLCAQGDKNHPPLPRARPHARPRNIPDFPDVNCVRDGWCNNQTLDRRWGQ